MTRVALLAGASLAALGCASTGHTSAAVAGGGASGFGDVVHRALGVPASEGAGALAFVEVSEARTADGLFRLTGGGDQVELCRGAGARCTSVALPGSGSTMVVPGETRPPRAPRGVWILSAGVATHCSAPPAGAPRCEVARLGGEPVFVTSTLAAHTLAPPGTDVVWLVRGPRSGSFVWMGVRRAERLVRCAASAVAAPSCAVPALDFGQVP